jgi:hypothetical protein
VPPPIQPEGEARYPSREARPGSITPTSFRTRVTATCAGVRPPFSPRAACDSCLLSARATYNIAFTPLRLRSASSSALRARSSCLARSSNPVVRRVSPFEIWRSLTEAGIGGHRNRNHRERRKKKKAFSFQEFPERSDIGDSATLISGSSGSQGSYGGRRLFSSFELDKALPRSGPRANTLSLKVWRV